MKIRIKTRWGGCPDITIIDNMIGYLLRFDEHVHELISYSEGVGFKYGYLDKDVAYSTFCSENEIIIAGKNADIIRAKMSALPNHVVVKKYKENSLIDFGFYQVPEVLRYEDL